MTDKVFLVTAEASGDLHAAILAREIKKIRPSASLIGAGGPNMEREGVRLFRRTDTLAIIGLSGIMSQLARIKELFSAVLENVEKEKAGLVVLIDYPGFNLRLAKALKKKNMTVVYYISPQIWAWGKSRINRIKKYVDKIIVFFGFESDIYKNAGIPVEFVGHPLVESTKPSGPKEKITAALGLDPSCKTIALLPGSRRREVMAHMPAMAAAADRLHDKHADTQFLIVRSEGIPEELIKKYTKNMRAPHSLVENTGKEMADYLAASDLAVVSSGTATLECAIMNVPMIIVYKVSLLNALIIKLFVRIPAIGLVNIIAGKKIVPELLQFGLTPSAIFRHARNILYDADRSRWIRAELSRVRSSLGEEGASRRAAEVVVDYL